jgi:uncharacterized membrane protein
MDTFGQVVVTLFIVGIVVLMYLFITKKLIWKDVKKDVKTKAEEIKKEMKKKGKL